MYLALDNRRINLETGFVFAAGSSVEARLSRRERSLLRFLVQRLNIDVSRETLQQEVWGFSSQSLSRAVDATVARLRRKIESNPTAPRFVLTVHGFGYRFVPPQTNDAEPCCAQTEGFRTPRGILVYDDLQIDLDRGAVSRGGTVIERLTAQEVRVLLRLRMDVGKTVGRDALLRLGSHFRLTPQGLANTVHRLRRKLPPGTVETVRGAGYRLRVGRSEAGPDDLSLTTPQGDHRLLSLVESHAPMMGPWQGPHESSSEATRTL